MDADKIKESINYSENQIKEKLDKKREIESKLMIIDAEIKLLESFVNTCNSFLNEPIKYKS